MNIRRNQLLTLLSILLSIAVVIIAAVSYFNIPTINKDYFIFEYGETIDLNSLDISNRKLTLVDKDNFSQEEEKYLDVGTYNLTYKYNSLLKSYSYVITIEVIDSVAPVFTKTADVITVKGSQDNFDYSSYFEAYDLSEVSYSYKTDKVKFNENGEYICSVIAKDVSGNTSTYDFKVVVEKYEKYIDPSTNITYIDGLIIANKKHSLPMDYTPFEDKEAAENLIKLIDEANSLNLSISYDYSGFRSYETQSTIYSNYVAKDGKENADRYSARPGYSEHQTGFAFDLRSPSGRLLETEKEVKWIADNCSRYGFILRYPEDKEEITGYMYEPWHLRYVGDKALDIAKSGLTLEEYYGFEGGTSY